MTAEAAVLQRFWSVGGAEDWTELPDGVGGRFGHVPVLSFSLNVFSRSRRRPNYNDRAWDKLKSRTATVPSDLNVLLVVNRLDDLLLQLLDFVGRRLVQTLLHVLQEAGVRRLALVPAHAPHQLHQLARGGRRLAARPLTARRSAVRVGGGRGGGGRGGGALGVGGSRRGRGVNARHGDGPTGGGLVGGGATLVEKFVIVVVAGVAEEHQLRVMFPLGKVEVLRTAGPVGAHRLVFALEDGPQVPELRLYVFH